MNTVQITEDLFTQCEKAVFSFVARNRGASFIEIKNVLSKIINTKGDYCLSLSQHNIVLWAGMSLEFFEIIKKMLFGDNRKLEMKETAWLTYMIDGETLNLPVAKKLPKQGYKKPHWLPVVFYAIGVNSPSRREVTK
jgi:hypothetical protein